nr:hypothetical protein [Serratia grimesii]
MKDSIKYGDEGGKDFGCVADELTPQACYRSVAPQTTDINMFLSNNNLLSSDVIYGNKCLFMKITVLTATVKTFVFIARHIGVRLENGKYPTLSLFFERSIGWDPLVFAD